MREINTCFKGPPFHNEFIETWCTKGDGLANLRDDFVRTETCARSNAHFFSPAVQLRTTVIGVDAACPGGVLIRKRWPSADTPYS